MDSCSTPDARLPALISKSKCAENPTDLLFSKLRERANFTYIITEQNDQKPHHGFAWPQVCATESDVDVSEIEVVRQSATMYDRYSGVVDELLPVVKSENVFGRDAEKELLFSELMYTEELKPQLSVIPIVGMSGIGKTTLARLIYEDRTVQQHFELKAWVKIDGQERNQLFDIAKKLLKSATGMLCPLNELDELDEMVVDTLLSHRSLIVLDDVESMDMELWQHLKDSWFRFVGLGSKIIITTRNRQVVEIVASKPFDLGELSQDDSWSLYSSLAFSLSKEREDDAKELAGQCKRVPLSLKLLGSMMRFEESLSSADIREKMTNFLDTSMVLSMSVLALPNDLFNCFAYCGIFPYGYVLEKEKLIKMWIANDVVKVKPSSMGMKSLEDIGEAYFHQLLCRSFFTDITWNEYGDIVQAQMPSVIQEYAHEIARVVFKDKVGYASVVDTNSLHLSLDLPFQQVYNPKNLQILLSFPPKDLDRANPNRSFTEFKRLRSLDLSRSGIRKLSKHICMMRKLRYLNLSHTLLTKLPKSFTTLSCLQTLDLSRCYYLKFLPKKMSNLSKLKHLDLSQCNSLCYTPSGIGSLNSLITMPLYVLGEQDSKCATLAELRKLNDLRGVLFIRNLENVMEISEAHAADLKEKKLHHLALCWSHKVDECHALLELLEPNPQLRVLELTGYGGYGFPSWMPNLRCLVKLVINDCRCTKLPTLGDLQALKELQLKELINIRSIGQEFYGAGSGSGDCSGFGAGAHDVFPSLEKLKLHGMPNLNSWSNADIVEGCNNHSSSRVFRRLKKLSIQGCPELQALPSLPALTELVVWRSQSRILPLLTRTKSLSSIVINDMNVKESFGGLSSVKKIIVVNCSDLDVLESSHINKFTALKFVRILHCLKLEYVKFSHLGSLEKLNVVDCQKLNKIDIITEDFALTELIIEDCPQLTSIDITTNSGSDFASGSASSLRKLIVRNCPKFSISPQKMGELKGLEFLLITGCAHMEEWLDIEKS